MRRRQLVSALGAATIGALPGCAATGRSGDASCPTYPGNETHGRTVCDGESAESPVYLSADSDTVSASSGVIEFTFANTTDRAVTYGPCLWTLYEQTSDGWRTIRDLQGDAIGARLPPNAETTLTLRLGESDPDADCNPYYIPEPLDPGRYLFGIQGNAPGGETTLFLASFHATK